MQLCTEIARGLKVRSEKNMATTIQEHSEANGFRKPEIVTLGVEEHELAVGIDVPVPLPHFVFRDRVRPGRG